MAVRRGLSIALVFELFVLPFAHSQRLQKLLPPGQHLGFSSLAGLNDVLTTNETADPWWPGNNRLSARQQVCENPGYVPCPNVDGCCPPGDDCFSDRCCDAGFEPCGSMGCYRPETSVCCEDNSRYCDIGETCCGIVCCYAGDICGGDGLCRSGICTEYDFLRITSVYKVVVYTTEEEEEEPEFVCPETSITNAGGTTLALGDDCGLTLDLPLSTESRFSLASSAAPSASGGFALQQPALRTPAMPMPKRQVSATACTSTKSVIVTETFTSTTTTTSTGKPEDIECPEVTVTNCLGDELELDDKCRFKFSPGDGSGGSCAPSASAAAGSNAQPSSSPTLASATLVSYLAALLVVVCVLVELV